MQVPSEEIDRADRKANPQRQPRTTMSYSSSVLFVFCHDSSLAVAHTSGAEDQHLSVLLISGGTMEVQCGGGNRPVGAFRGL